VDAKPDPSPEGQFERQIKGDLLAAVEIAFALHKKVSYSSELLDRTILRVFDEIRSRRSGPTLYHPLREDPDAAA
jgi:hypothetical protein